MLGSLGGLVHADLSVMTALLLGGTGVAHSGGEEKKRNDDLTEHVWLRLEMRIGKERDR